MGDHEYDSPEYNKALARYDALVADMTVAQRQWEQMYAQFTASEA